MISAWANGPPSTLSSNPKTNKGIRNTTQVSATGLNDTDRNFSYPKHPLPASPIHTASTTTIASHRPLITRTQPIDRKSHVHSAWSKGPPAIIHHPAPTLASTSRLNQQGKPTVTSYDGQMTGQPETASSQKSPHDRSKSNGLDRITLQRPKPPEQRLPKNSAWLKGPPKTDIPVSPVYRLTPAIPVPKLEPTPEHAVADVLITSTRQQGPTPTQIVSTTEAGSVSSDRMSHPSRHHPAPLILQQTPVAPLKPSIPPLSVHASSSLAAHHLRSSSLSKPEKLEILKMFQTAQEQEPVSSTNSPATSVQGVTTIIEEAINSDSQILEVRRLFQTISSPWPSYAPSSSPYTSFVSPSIFSSNYPSTGPASAMTTEPMDDWIAELDDIYIESQSRSPAHPVGSKPPPLVLTFPTLNESMMDDLLFRVSSTPPSHRGAQRAAPKANHDADYVHKGLPASAPPTVSVPAFIGHALDPPRNPEFHTASSDEITYHDIRGLEVHSDPTRLSYVRTPNQPNHTLDIYGRPIIMSNPISYQPPYAFPWPRNSAEALEAVAVRLDRTFKDVDEYRRLLSYRGSEAHSLLDTFQTLLDTCQLTGELRRNLIVATRRLSTKTNFYPRSFDLPDVEPLSQQALASGSFADIYTGRLQGEIVCLKVVRVYQRSVYEHIVKAIAQEAIIWGQLRHSSLLPFYGLHLFRMQISFVCPWAENGRVIDFLKEFSHVDRTLLVSDTAEGVAYLHENDIVHGDLKGANILVDGVGRAYIGDFGLSAIADSEILHWTSHSSAASRGGTVRWQAPELIVPENSESEKSSISSVPLHVHNTTASDIYALACVFYEIFTGRLPFFEYNREHTVMVNVGAGNRPSRPADVIEQWMDWGLTDYIWDLMTACWAHERTCRPTSVEVLTWLAAIKPEDPRPLSLWAESAKRVRGIANARHQPLTSEELEELLSRESVPSA